MIKLTLEPYCQNCGAFVAETAHQEMFAGGEKIDDLIAVYCENAEKCASLYDYIQKSMEEKEPNSRKMHTS